MGRTTKPLTNTEAKQSKPRDKEYNLADGHGLALRIKPNGSRLWIFNYTKPHTKKRANIGFGAYPEIPLAEARRMRQEARSLLAKNIDPKEHKDIASAKEKAAGNNTLKSVASAWFNIKKASVTASYADDIWRSLELHIFPKLGKVPIHKIHAPQVITTLKPLAAKGSLETVKRVCQRINEVQVYAVNSGIIESNRLTGIATAFKTPNKQNLPTLKPEELPNLVKAIKESSIKVTTKNLILWQLHTMVRPSEAAGASWAEIDAINQLWHIPAGRMKKKKPHTVPLSNESLEILKNMKPISGHRKFIFPADRNPRSHAHPQTANMALKRIGYKHKLVAHGLRALASTTMNEAGFDPDIIESALAHTDSNQTRAAYNRADYIQRRVKMMEWWSTKVEFGDPSPDSTVKQLIL